MAETEKKEHGAGLYVGIWVALVALTTLTYGLGQVELGAWQLPIGLLIAAVKATLVVLFFMHLTEHAPSNRLVFATSIVFVGLLIALTLGDFGFRFKGMRPPGMTPLDLSPGAPAMHYTNPSDVGHGIQRR